MRRFGQIIRVKPGQAEKYIEHHAAVWPGVLKMIRECNISKYSIFYKDDYLFAYLEYTGADFEADMERMAADPETQRWWKVVRPLTEPVENKKPGEFWADMEEVFHLE